ncbi:MAG: hypothetical protein WBQ08_08560 [Candidatus Sulfotelmatobacter sp.]
MKRLILSFLALVLICGASWVPAQAAATLTRVKATHAPVTRHKAHKAVRHRQPKHRRTHRRRGV